MIYINYILLKFFIIFIYGQLSISLVDSLPIYNPSTRCHELTLSDEDLTFAICFQRSPNKQHPHHLFTSSSFCSTTYPPNGHLLDLVSLSSSTIDKLLQNLITLLNTKNNQIDLPEPNFLWISSNFTQNLINHPHWCPDQCQSKNHSTKHLILKLRCQYDNNNNNSKPCLTTKHTHWDRAPFICLQNQVIKPKAQTISKPSVQPALNYFKNTIVFYDSTPCVIVRTDKYQYTFCFRRQSCPQSQTSAFCTTKSDAYNICQNEKNNSSLLTIENDSEYQLINDIIRYYSNQTLLNAKGLIKNKYIQRAQWMWIDGLRETNDTYRWHISQNILKPIPDKYWCDNITNCSGGKGRDHVVLNIICQTSNRTSQICLASRRQSEPGPFICKRSLTDNEEPVTDFTYLRDIITTPSPDISPVYEKNLTSIYYDEHHCLTVQTRTHLYTFCLRRQNCTLRKAFCTKWSQAQKECQLLKNGAQLLTIDNAEERSLITDIINNYHNETRLTYNGSTYRYYQLADYLWIDGIQQKNPRTYLWKNDVETIPDNLWCPENECNSTGRARVMLNLLCKRNNSLVCLGTRVEWKPAPYICKRIRPNDICPILFDEIRYIQSNEMLVITVDRTIALIKCKHPKYNSEIKVEYQCNSQTNQWKLIYKNDNFTCPDYNVSSITPTADKKPGPHRQTTKGVKSPQPFKKTTPTTSTTSSTQQAYFITTISTKTITTTTATPSAISETDCSQSDLSTLISRLPTQSRYVHSQRLPSISSTYYDTRLICYFNNLTHITYRCDLLTKQWVYVYGNTNGFRQCYPPCSNNERSDLLNKYFSLSEQTKIRTNYIQKTQSLYLRCFNPSENRWISINYKCGTMSITTHQWFKLYSCFRTPIITPPSVTTTLPPVMVSMSVTQLTSTCPSTTVIPICAYETGQYIFDINGCLRKVCPLTSQLCNTIRCPPDRICRVIPCKSCIHTDYLQAVCEYATEPTLCDLDKQLLLLKDHQSIDRWEQQTIAIVKRYADEQRQRLISPWPVLTIN